MPERLIEKVAIETYDASMAALGTLARAASPFSNKLRELAGDFRTDPGPCAVWVHACSAGEMTIARRFVDCWRKKTGQNRAFISAWTRDGYRIASAQHQPGEQVGWFPLDSRAAMRRAYDTLRPRAIVLCETELWPNHLAEAQARSIPVFVINGRMSQRDQANYLRLGRLADRLFDVPDTVFAQSEDDARRFSVLGAHRTVVTGNMKFDRLDQTDNGTIATEEFGAFPCILAASTHPGEEASVLRAFRACAPKHAGLKLVIAPRHVKRSTAIVRLARRNGMRACVWPRDGSIGDADCIVIDRVGLLPRLYEHAEFAFIGKSLRARGGQNFLEAVEAGCPVVVGPYTENFDNMLAPFREADAVRKLSAAEELAGQFATLIEDEEARRTMACKSKEIKRQLAGATEATVRGILARL